MSPESPSSGGDFFFDSFHENSNSAIQQFSNSAIQQFSNSEKGKKTKGKGLKGNGKGNGFFKGNRLTRKGRKHQRAILTEYAPHFLFS
ncbi:TPA: hypothetical protein I8Y21_005995 [Klebsiella oxytoca]|uniref:Uncharacterized protein n=1 Tax=Klebsiella oxytoca TaxID=571 RepID=A0AAN5LE83_KLEOX|nr:hypothetical protein [Klebsiella oxytoca]